MRGRGFKKKHSVYARWRLSKRLPSGGGQLIASEERFNFRPNRHLARPLDKRFVFHCESNCGCWKCFYDFFNKGFSEALLLEAI